MKVIFAFDSFKGTLTSEQACIAAKNGFLSVFPEAKPVIIPIADGGEGTAFAYHRALGGEVVTVSVTSPQYKKTEASYTILPDRTAVIEMAQASGITLVEGERDGANATSYGTGELISDALKRGCRRFIIGLGGSATNDGGCGALAALGVKFLTNNGQSIPLTGNGLALLEKIDYSEMNPLVHESEFIIACDVENTLCGKNGATYVYGPQKGVSVSDLERLDNNLLFYAQKIKQTTGRDVLNIKGGGAAGGMCAGLLGF